MEIGSKEGLLSTLTQFNTAFAQGDLEFLDKHTTDNYRHTNSAGKAFEKDAWFNYLKNRKEDLESGALKIEAYELSEVDVQMHEDAAIITGKILTKGLNKEIAFQRFIRVSHFWVFEEGSWKRAGFHDTRIE